jgi:hypothetical protein
MVYIFNRKYYRNLVKIISSPIKNQEYDPKGSPKGCPRVFPEGTEGNIYRSINQCYSNLMVIIFSP